MDFRTKEEIAYQQLREALITCKLPPGEKIVIDRLAEDMGISQIPVRAAVQRLIAEGLVLSQPHSSATAAPLSPEKIDEVFILLEALERTAFTTAAGRMSPEHLDKLQSLADSMDAALAASDSRKWLHANIDFHRTIAKAAGLPLLVDFTNRVLDEWERICHFYFDPVTSLRLPQAQQEHRRIIALLETGSAEELAQLAAVHNRSANQAYQQLLHAR